MTIAGVQVPSVYECADGFTLITIGFGPVFGQMTQRLAKWAAEEGHADHRIAEIKLAVVHQRPVGAKNVAIGSASAGRRAQVAGAIEDQG